MLTLLCNLFYLDSAGVFICNVDCTKTANWQSPNKIICHSGNAVGKGDVVVTTYSGGRGSCTVRFTGIREVIGMQLVVDVYALYSMFYTHVFVLICVFASETHTVDPYTHVCSE